MRCLNVVKIFFFASVLGACATDPNVSEAPLAYSTETPDQETLQAIHAQATPDPVTPQAAMTHADEVVCRREAQPGSNIRVRRCYTRSQLDAQARRSQEWIADELSQSGSSRDGAVFGSSAED